MKAIKLTDINIYDIGNEIQVAGTVWSGKGISFVTLVPGKENEDLSNLKVMPLTLQDWQALNTQGDLQETEVFTKDPTGLVKIIIRRSARNLDQFLQWSFWRRDNFSCRYCGRADVPVTVDHVDLWEDGGPAILENLITACRTCNKDRGRTQYEDWLNSTVYKRKSQNLDVSIKKLNEDILQTLPTLRSQRVQHVRSR